MISPEEQAALDELNKDVQKLKLDCYAYMELLTSPTTVLETCGFRHGLPLALKSTLDHTMRAINLLQQQFLKQFPDTYQ